MRENKRRFLKILKTEPFKLSSDCSSSLGNRSPSFLLLQSCFVLSWAMFPNYTIKLHKLHLKLWMIPIRGGPICNWVILITKNLLQYQSLHMTVISETNMSQKPLCLVSMSVPQNKAGLTPLAGDVLRSCLERCFAFLFQGSLNCVHRQFGRPGYLSCCIISSSVSWLQFSLKERWLPTSSLIIHTREHAHTCADRDAHKLSSACWRAMWSSLSPSPSFPP